MLFNRDEDCIETIIGVFASLEAAEVAWREYVLKRYGPGYWTPWTHNVETFEVKP